MGILYSSSKVLVASETVLAFGWAKTCSTMDFSHSSSSTVPRYRAWNDCAWMEWLNVQEGLSGSNSLSFCWSGFICLLCTAKIPAPGSAYLGCFFTLVSEETPLKWSTKEQKCMFSSTSHKESNPWMAKVQQENSAKPWTSLSLIPLPLHFCQCRDQGQMKCWEKMKPITGAKKLSHRIRLKSAFFFLFWLWQ